MNINKLEKVFNLGRADTTLGNFRLYFNDVSQFCIDHSGVLVYNHVTSNSDATVLVATINQVYDIRYDYDWRKPLCAIVDFIYNFESIKTDLTFKNGEIKRKWYTELSARFRAGNEYPFTDYLLNVLISKTNVDTVKLESGNWTFNKFKNLLTNDYWYYRSTIGQDFNGSYTHVPRHVNFKSLGYDWYDGFGWYDATQGTMEIGGVSYPRAYAQKRFKICKTCNAHSLKLFNGECQTCLGVDPELIQIRSYSDRAPHYLKFKEGKYSKALYKEPLYLGVELEMECDDNTENDLVYAAKTLGSHCIFKRDGSIRNGFEIVSTAATLDVHKEEWKAFFADVTTKSTLHEAESVGMHVHVSRQPLSVLTVGKMTEFMNLSDNKQYFEQIAGRWSDRFAGQENRSVTFAFRHQGGGERYNALNLKNKATVEFRIFASTRDYDEFFMRLEFCEAVTHYCSPCQSKATTLKDVSKWEWFAKYVHDNHKAWPLLSTFIKGL